MKNKHMQEANRLAEMEYTKSREEMGIPSKPSEEDDRSERRAKGLPVTLTSADMDYFGAGKVEKEDKPTDHDWKEWVKTVHPFNSIDAYFEAITGDSARLSDADHNMGNESTKKIYNFLNMVDGFKEQSMNYLYTKYKQMSNDYGDTNEADQFNTNVGDNKISKEPGFSSNRDDSYEEGRYDNEGNPLKPGGEEDFETMFYRSLNGCEIQSMDFEGTVYVDGRKKCIFRDGEKMRPSEDELKTLWKEYVDGEGLEYVDGEGLDEVAGLEQFKSGMKLKSKSNGNTYTIQMVQPSMVKGMEASMALKLKDDKTGKEFDDSPGNYEIVTNEVAMEEELNEIKRITKQLLGE